jgi:hypothetical protein
VIDFTTMSDAELGRIINTTKGEICGRMTSEQMNRPIVLETYPSHWSARWVMAFTALVSFSGTLLAKPFHHLPDIKIFQSEKKDLEIVDNSNRLFKIRLIDSLTKEPVAFAGAIIKGTNQLVNADIDGIFQFSVLDSTSFLEIEFVHVLFHSKNLQLDLNELIKDPFLTFELIQKVYTLSQLELAVSAPRICRSEYVGITAVYIDSVRPNLWHRFLNIFKRKSR